MKLSETLKNMSNKKKAVVGLGAVALVGLGGLGIGALNTPDKTPEVAVVTETTLSESESIQKDLVLQAENLVSNLEMSALESDIELAKNAVDRLPEGDTKTALLTRINVVVDQINQSKVVAETTTQAVETPQETQAQTTTKTVVNQPKQSTTSKSTTSGSTSSNSGTTKKSSSSSRSSQSSRSTSKSTSSSSASTSKSSEPRTYPTGEPWTFPGPAPGSYEASKQLDEYAKQHSKQTPEEIEENKRLLGIKP